MTSEKMGDRPNIILIHAHDLGDWLGTYGYPAVPTPHLDALATRSVVFEKAFSTAPLCTPARSSIFTGRLPHENGLMGLTHAGWTYAPDVVTLPEVLRGAGYRTALIGLQHEDLDARVLGFDEVHGLGFLPRALEVADLLEQWLDGRASDEQPFFASVGMWEVHRPWPESDYHPADPAAVTVPAYLPDNEHTRRDISRFYGAIRQMDDAVGRMMAAIDRQPQGQDTVVIFTTDHGVAFPRAKSTLYDSGVKVALLMRIPERFGVPAGRAGALASHLDILPTVAHLAGVSVDQNLTGMNLLDRARHEGEDDRVLFFEKTYHDRYDPIRAVRTAGAKYIRNFVDGPVLPLSLDLEQSDTRVGMGDAHLAPRSREELYLLTEDPDELVNRQAEPGMGPLKEDLAHRLHEHLVASADPVLEGAIAAPPAPERARR